MFDQPLERVLHHLSELAGGTCSIDVDDLQAEQDESLQAVLIAIQMLHEDLEFARAQQQARLEAEAADRAKSAFMTTMSHELRTPLNAILGYTELVEEMIETNVEPEQVLEDLGRVKHAGSHLLQLINDVLDLARIEAGEESLEAQEVDLVEVARQAAETLEPLAHEKDLELILELQPLTVMGDRRRLLQCILNLGMNAVKFTERGSVRLVTRDLQIEVHDTGPGITPDALAAIFEPFGQTELGHNKGTGLGLTITRRLAEAMGGRAIVRSQPGIGSVFTLQFAER